MVLERKTSNSYQRQNPKFQKFQRYSNISWSQKLFSPHSAVLMVPKCWPNMKGIGPLTFENGHFHFFALRPFCQTILVPKQFGKMAGEQKNESDRSRMSVGRFPSYLANTQVPSVLPNAGRRASNSNLCSSTAGISGILGFGAGTNLRFFAPKPQKKLLYHRNFIFEVSCYYNLLEKMGGSSFANPPLLRHNLDPRSRGFPSTFRTRY